MSAITVGRYCVSTLVKNKLMIFGFDLFTGRVMPFKYWMHEFNSDRVHFQLLRCSSSKTESRGVCKLNQLSILNRRIQPIHINKKYYWAKDACKIPKGIVSAVRQSIQNLNSSGSAAKIGRKPLVDDGPRMPLSSRWCTYLKA